MSVITPPGPAASGTARSPATALSGGPTRPPGPPADGSADSPIQAIPTLIGAAAVLAATFAIPPMIRGSGWWWPTVEVVVVIWLVGVGARLARLPSIAIMLLQVAAVCVALTALFTTGGIGGVIPNGTVLAEAGDLLSGAWDQIRSSVPPAPATVQLSFLVAVTVAVTALIVDILIAVCRAPALVALPLLCLYSVPASINAGMLPWLAFAGPAMLYAMLLVTTGLQGRRIGTGAGVARVVTGVGLAALTTVVALLVASSVTGVGTTGRLPRSGVSSASSGVGLSPFASLRGNLVRGEPVEMLRITGLPAPDYLRTIGLQRWTGESWSVDTLASGQLPSAPLPGETAQVVVSAAAYRDRFLPIYADTTVITGLDDGWSYDAALESVHRDEAITPPQYQLTVGLGRPSAEALRADTVTPGGLLTETGPLSAEVLELTDQITDAEPTAFDKAEALRRYFTEPANGFVYSLDVPAGDSGDALVDFLRIKQGYCEQYASAMAVMLRAAGVPARVAIGFTQGSQAPDGSYVITSNDAHAWVEVLFNSAGWVRFDPTPLGTGQGGQQGFAPATAEQTTPTTAGGPSSLPAQELEETATESGGTAAPSIGVGADAASATELGPDIGPTVWAAIVVLALLAASASVPSLVRAARRRRRFAIAAGGGPGAASAAWREIEDLAVDHGLGIAPAESARVTANRLAKAAHLTGDGRDRLRAVVIAAEREWYGDDGPAGAGAAGGMPPGEPPSRGGADDAAGAAGGWGLPGSSAAAGAGTVVADRPAGTALGRPDLAEAARSLAAALDQAAPLAPLERLVPRSVRPRWWRP